MDIRVRSATRSWTVYKYVYILKVNIRSLRHPCPEIDTSSTHVQDEAEGDFCPDASGGTIAPEF